LASFVSDLFPDYTVVLICAGVDVIVIGVVPIGSNRVWHENLLSQLSWVTGHRDEHCAGVSVSAAADDAGVGAIGVGAAIGCGGGGIDFIAGTPACGSACGGANVLEGAGRGFLNACTDGCIGGGGASSTTGGSNAGFSGAAGASWKFSTVTPHGDKYKKRNPTKATASNAAITNNIDNCFAIFYL
jgi:hypothetical protein